MTGSPGRPAPRVLPSDRQPLLVPYARRGEARAAGASWDAHAAAWSVPRDRAGDVPRAMLPLRDRPGLQPPYIRINLVPQTSWGRNVRALLDKEAWRRFAREHVYSSTGSLCLVCGMRGPEWPVEADEVWRYDDQAGVQKLVDVVPLCPSCHEVRSAGKATAEGRGGDVARHLAWVDRRSVRSARDDVEAALRVWRERSRRRWTIDVSLMERRWGIAVRHTDEASEAVHRALVDDARTRARQLHSRA